jgi:predicted dehydrogenase
MRVHEGGSVRVLFAGESKCTAIRRQALRSGQVAGIAVDVIDAANDQFGPGSVCFTTLASDDAWEQSKRLLKSGCHVFLDSVLVPLQDLQQLALVAEEAGVEVGVSRPLRYSTALTGWNDRATIATVAAEFGDGPDSWQQCLLHTMDLCVHLCGTGNTRRVEASVERADQLWPLFAAVSLRFDNGSLALASLRKTASGPGPTRCTITTGPLVSSLELASGTEAYEAETRDFLARVARGAPAPVSISDGLAGVRLLDQVQALLR